MLRKIAVAAASKPAVEIRQEGESFYIKTSTTVRTTEISFKVGEEFEEQTVDGRPCKVSGAPLPPPAGPWGSLWVGLPAWRGSGASPGGRPSAGTPLARLSLLHPLTPLPCPVQSLVKWESDHKMVCEQQLLKGEGPKTGWTREMTNDGELILVRGGSCQTPPPGPHLLPDPPRGEAPWHKAKMAPLRAPPLTRVPSLAFQTMTVDDVVCTRIYVRE